MVKLAEQKYKLQKKSIFQCIATEDAMPNVCYVWPFSVQKISSKDRLSLLDSVSGLYAPRRVALSTYLLAFTGDRGPMDTARNMWSLKPDTESVVGRKQ